MIEYELLKIIWWVLVGVLLIGFALTDGFDMGSMALMPFVGKTDNERRAAINTIAPHWDGNQVWFYHCWWCTICSLANGILGRIFRNVLGLITCAICPVLTSCRF